MPPKQAKKQVPETATIDIVQLQKKWADNVKEIITIREKLSHHEKLNDELISQLWEVMNKNPTNCEVVVEETEKPVAKTVKKDKPEEDEDKPATKAAPKSATKKTVVKTTEDTDEKPAEKAIKTVKKKAEKPEVEKPAEKPEVKKPAAKGKITAPTKGTPKPKSSNDEEKKPVIPDSSSDDTDIDSLSSVSSESDASGGEDD
jgi:hypothetical protein